MAPVTLWMSPLVSAQPQSPLATATMTWSTSPLPPPGTNTITVGNGNNDTVNITAAAPGTNTITVGNGNNDTVNASLSPDSTITVGNGNDTIYVGRNDTVTVGTGHDSFIFEQTTPGNIGAVTVNHFDPDKDIFTFSSQLTTSVSYHDNAQGNAVVTVDNSGELAPVSTGHPA
jgi:Ca2+-binding RTX toxin-like protein